MRVLIDECVPHDIRHQLPGHSASTVSYMCWSGKKNGELLSLMIQDGFEVLLTVDQNLKHQQNLSAAGIAVVVLVADSTELSDLIPLMPGACAALGVIKPGDVVEVTA